MAMPKVRVLGSSGTATADSTFRALHICPTWHTQGTMISAPAGADHTMIRMGGLRDNHGPALAGSRSHQARSEPSRLALRGAPSHTM
jgi:hypothetical protein